MRVAFHMESLGSYLISPILNSNDAGRKNLVLKTYFDKTTGISKNLLLSCYFCPQCFDYILRFCSGNPMPFSAFSCTHITPIATILRQGKEIPTLVGLFTPVVSIS